MCTLDQGATMLRDSVRWRQVRDFPNYFVSDRGAVKNMRGRLMSLQIHYGRYSKCLKIILQRCGVRKNARVHILVATAFLDREPHHTQVNHKDYNTFNNYVDNLEWSTQLENCYHRDERG